MMKAKSLIFGAAALCIFSPAQAVTFSVSGTGPSPAPPDDILLPGPAPIYVGGVGLNVNGFSYSYDAVHLPAADALIFSVDAASFGVAGTAVDAEGVGGGAPGEQSAGIYFVTSPGVNTHLHDGDGVLIGVSPTGIPPVLGLAESMGIGAPFDDVDGIDARDFSASGDIFWTMDTPSGAGLGLSPSSIFVGAAAAGFSGASVLWADAALLGLDPADDIDALVIFEDGVGGATAGDSILFSLAAGSPSLGGLGVSPSDVLITSPGGPASIAIPSADLGLVAGMDELNALDIMLPIPEPSSSLLVGLFSLLLLRRRR